MNWKSGDGDGYYIETDTGYRVCKTGHAKQYLYTAWGKRGEIIGIYDSSREAKKACAKVDRGGRK